MPTIMRRPVSAPAEQTAATQSATPGYAPAATDPNAGAAPSASAINRATPAMSPVKPVTIRPARLPIRCPANRTWLPTREKILTTGRAEQATTFRLMRPSLSPAQRPARLTAPRPRATPRRLPATPRPLRLRARRIPTRTPHPRSRLQPVHLLARTKRQRRRRTASASAAPVFCG